MLRPACPELAEGLGTNGLRRARERALRSVTGITDNATRLVAELIDCERNP
jgi:hypothetical protein